MNAEIGIDEEGRAYVAFSRMTDTEHALVKYLRPFLPIRDGVDGMLRIIGERLPGSGKATP